MPDPVGPVTRKMPWGEWINASTASPVPAAMPSASSVRRPPCLSRSRSTTRSPLAVGMVETRTSIARPAMRSVMRPSCGKRFSAMSSEAMTLMRETIAGCSPRRGSTTSRKAPSTRKRTAARDSKISRWTSEAPSRTAWVRSALMRRMIGASFSVSRRSATSGSWAVSLARSTESPMSSTMVSAADGSRVYASTRQ